MIDADLAIIHKTRPQHQEVELLETVGEIEGKTCIIFDDMIDTAGSLLSAKKALIEQGANPEIYAAATHPIFSGKAAENINKAKFAEVVVTDSIPTDAAKIPTLKILPIAPMLAEVIKHIELGQSVTEIYKK